jgi:hypothetical protein
MAKLDPHNIVHQLRGEVVERKRAAAYAIQSAWKALARNKLTGKRSKSEYIGSIEVTDSVPDKISVALVGTLANIREQGMGPGGIGTQGPYDVRKFLLRDTTKSIRRSKTGARYLHVPFSHTRASIAAEAASLSTNSAKTVLDKLSRGTTWSRLYQRFAGGGFRGTTSMPGRGTRWGSRLAAGHAKNRRPRDVRIRDAQGKHTGWTQRAHATDILAGMVRKDKKYAKDIQSTYQTFRTASEAGKPWVSRGVRAERLGQQIARNVPHILRKAGVL